jgi:hypothetical protein
MVYPSNDLEIRTRLLARQLRELRDRLREQLERAKAALEAEAQSGVEAAGREEAREAEHSSVSQA